MGVTTEKAFEILNLPLGSSKDAIEQSYKRLAVKWHPEKCTGPKSTRDALKKFKSVSLAYRKLILNERDIDDITLHEMFDQYRQVFRGDKKSKLLSHTQIDVKPLDKNNNGSTTNSTSSVRASVQLQEINNNINNNHKANHSHTNPHLHYRHHHQSLHQNSHHQYINNSNNSHNEENHENQFHSYRKHDDHIADCNLKISQKQKAKACAIKGNELAMQEEYAKAVEKFTEAIKYDPSDHRLYGNRSFCYDKMNLFQEAYEDAEKAIKLESSWPKGYYRKGRALYGLKMYKEAEEAFMQLLEFDDINEPELEEELMEVRVLQLQEMGFSKAQSEIAVKNHGSVTAALESMLMIGPKDKLNDSFSESDDELNADDGESCDTNSEYDHKNKRRNELNHNDKSANHSDDNSEFKLVAPSSKRSNLNVNRADKQKANHDHSAGAASTSLWIGNVDPDVGEEVLTEMFAAFGSLTNVRCLPEKYCAFINYRHREDAAKAMQTLQGKVLEGQRLLIKYPDNPNTAILSSMTTTKPFAKNGDAGKPMLKADAPKHVKKVAHVDTSDKNSDQSNSSKLSGPVNGNECYFWRTTGCLYADKCRYEHIKKNKGIDKKPWHK